MEPSAIVDLMLKEDAFSKWLGLTVKSIQVGYCQVEMTIRTEMCNGFGTAHGGIAHSLADSAFAFACNAHGYRAVAAETATSYLRPLFAGDHVVATCEEVHRGKKLGRYRVLLTRGEERVAVFTSTCYVLPDVWEPQG